MQIDGIDATYDESGWHCADDLIQCALNMYTKQIQMEPTGFEYIPDYEEYLMSQLSKKMQIAGYAVET